MDITQKGSDCIVSGISHFDAAETFSCGQCFRFRPVEGRWEGVAGRRLLRLSQRGDALTFHDTAQEEVESFWLHYLDLHRDYQAIKDAMEPYPVLRRAAAYAPGIRVLNQDGWEALCTFIISQNNHIQRIAGIVERLCDSFGQELEGGRRAFPTPQALAGRSPEELGVLRAGFRARYILDAACKVAWGEVDLSAIPSMDTPAAVRELRSILGVGDKVACCALLFGFGRSECVPVDVWIKRALARHFPGGFPPELAGQAGIIQQFVFQYVRLCPEALA